MNYYIFKNFPKLNIETFHKDEFWFNDTRSKNHINAMMVKFIWGYNKVGGQFVGLTDTQIWFER